MKNVVFCADGTWDGPGQTDTAQTATNSTNVFKLFVNLDGVVSTATALLANEQERVLTDDTGTVLQHAKYLHGVGDSENFLVRLLGGTLGAGLIARIVRGYTFISRNYAPGDKIYIIGFSRGAYTARALAGLIAAKGLLDASKVNLDDRDNAYRLGAAVWYAYRRSALSTNRDLFGQLEQIALDLPHFLSQPPADGSLLAAPIEAVAVWDTVGSLGIPEYTLHAARVDALQFVDRRLSDKVAHGVHAIAIDERRADFTPTLWDPDGRIVQVLFPGEHSDVGGGYPPGGESGLSDCTLVWMTTQLTALGVRFARVPLMASTPQPLGPGHQPWTDLPWRALPIAARVFPAGLLLAQCVIDRCGGGLSYAPTNLADYLTGQTALAGVRVVRQDEPLV